MSKPILWTVVGTLLVAALALYAFRRPLHKTMIHSALVGECGRKPAAERDACLTSLAENFDRCIDARLDGNESTGEFVVCVGLMSAEGVAALRSHSDGQCEGKDLKVKVEAREASEQKVDAADAVETPDGRKVYLLKTPLFSNPDIVKVEFESQESLRTMNLTLAEPARKRFEGWTAQRAGTNAMFAIVVDRTVIGPSIVLTAITGDTLRVATQTETWARVCLGK